MNQWKSSIPGQGQPAIVKGGKGSVKEQLNATLDEQVKGDTTAAGANHSKPEVAAKKPTDSGPKVPKKGTDGVKNGSKGKGTEKPDM